MQYIFINMQKNGKFNIGQLPTLIQTEICSVGRNTIGSA